MGYPAMGRPEVIYVDNDGVSREAAIVGGELTSSRDGMNYTMAFDLELSDGNLLKGSFEGRMSIWYETEGDFTIDYNDDLIAPYAYAENFIDARLWRIVLAETDEQYAKCIDLFISGEPNLDYPPVGRFPMAAKARQFVAGTAEPTSWYDGQYDIGCQNYGMGGFAQISIPNEGFVDVQWVSNSAYKISFEFMGRDGHTVSGTYTGYVEGGQPSAEPDPFEVARVGATYWGPGMENENAGEWLIYFQDFAGKDVLYFNAIFSRLLEDDEYKLPAGTYTYKATTSSTDVNCFKNCFYYDDACTKGTFTVSYDGDDIVMDFDLTLKSGSVYQARYKGPVDWENLS
jgi:hypothetical protein